MILIGMSDILVDDSVVMALKPKKRKSTFGELIIEHIRKISLLILNFFFNHDWLFAVIGWFNKRWNFLYSVFVAYPANEKYASAYAYKFYHHKMRWLPWPTGIFKQNGKWGLMMVISSTEEDFTTDNLNNLKIFVERTEKIRQLLGAKQKTFAGILPGVLFMKRMIRKSPEVDVTVEAVLQAEREIKPIIGYPDSVPLIILGGKGFVGRRLIKKLIGREVFCVDTNGNSNNTDTNEWTKRLYGRKAILINLTRKAVLSGYIHLFWSDLVLINEVYPEPKQNELRELTNKNIFAYHIVGLKAKSFPSFPRAYRGGIPCCAGHIAEGMEVIVKKLN